MMILSVAIFIGILILSFKITWFIVKICGKLLGLLLCIIGYVFLGAIGVSLIGIAIVIIPIVFIVGISAILSAISSVI